MDGEVSRWYAGRDEAAVLGVVDCCGGGECDLYGHRAIFAAAGTASHLPAGLGNGGGLLDLPGLLWGGADVPVKLECVNPASTVGGP